MEKKRFSSDELYQLRNDILVAELIENGLDIPSHTRQGRFCFLCPLCQEFNTAVNPRSNQAKCFTCEKLFNTIDLVMEARQWDFADSVRFLRKFYANLPQGGKHQDLKPAIFCRQPERPGKEAASHGPEHIGQILAGVMSLAPSAENNPSAKNTDTHNLRDRQDRQPSNDRILELEQKVEHLSRQIEKMVKLMNQIPSH